MPASARRATVRDDSSMPARLTVSAIVPATDAPPTLAACVEAIRGANDPPDELIVVDEPRLAGPAAARNRGAAGAAGDVLVFVDADVVVHPDAFSRIRAALGADPGLVAIFGAYDDRTSAHGAVSAFRNLLHHHVHSTSAGPATTFWTGVGAVRREAFLSHGGFDEHRYPRASIEDVDFGMRLASAGARIVLDPGIRGTHLKSWTLVDMVRTDFARRGVPWVVLLCRHRSVPATLNLRWPFRLSAALSATTLFAAWRGRPGIAAASLTALVFVNRRFYRLLYHRRGVREAALGVGLHGLHHLTSVAAVPAGIAAYLRERRLARAANRHEIAPRQDAAGRDGARP